MTLTLQDLKRHIDNMYAQLDKNQIDFWPVDELEILADDEDTGETVVFILQVNKLV